MSTHPVPAAVPAIAIVGRVAKYLRQPANVTADPSTSDLTFTFTPDLDAAELVTFDRLVALARSGLVNITPDEYAAIEDDLAAVRLFRQQSQSEFIALAQNARDRALFDVVNALINIQRAILRE